MSERTVVVVRDAELLAELVALRLISRLVDVQARRGTASVVLTGGGTGTAVLAAVRRSPALDAVDWRRVELWWGDERWLPAADPERNELQARQALLDALDLDPARVHPFGAPDGAPDHGQQPDDVEAAAARYADALTAAAPDGQTVPAFDVLLLGVGSEGHVASIFPDSAAVDDDRLVTAVHGSPKPPPTRLTLGFPTICAAREVWLVVAGAAKAGAVTSALAGADRARVPAAGAVGRELTLWLLDEAAAAELTPAMRGR